jgi:hypothetical protein
MEGWKAPGLIASYARELASPDRVTGNAESRSISGRKFNTSNGEE